MEKYGPLGGYRIRKRKILVLRNAACKTTPNEKIVPARAPRHSAICKPQRLTDTGGDRKYLDYRAENEI